MSKKRSSEGTSCSVSKSSSLPLRLTVQQRQSLLSCTRLKAKIKERIRKAPEGTQVIEFKWQELDPMSDELTVAAGFVPHPDKARLIAVLKKVDDLLDGLLDSPDAGAPRRVRPADGSSVLFQFKITLRDVSPSIWRRIQIEDCNLEKLHEIIQTAMGWQDDHMHEFVIDGERVAPIDPEFGWDGECLDEHDIRISELLPTSARRTRWLYVYDFGDNWRHDIVFEGYPARREGEKYPICLEGELACPPEDIGGAWRYAEFLDSIKARPARNEACEDDEDAWDDEFEEFDPKRFDAGLVTAELKKISRRRHRAD